jgi:hypothetical protein
VLLVTGIDYPGHKWRETTPVLVKALESESRLRVDVLEDPYRLDGTDLIQYRAVFLHFLIRMRKPRKTSAVLSSAGAA